MPLNAVYNKPFLNHHLDINCVPPGHWRKRTETYMQELKYLYLNLQSYTSRLQEIYWNFNINGTVEVVSNDPSVKKYSLKNRDG